MHNFIKSLYTMQHSATKGAEPSEPSVNSILCKIYPSTLKIYVTLYGVTKTVNETKLLNNETSRVGK